MCQYRSEHPNEGVQYIVHRRLGAAPGLTVGGVAVHPVLEHVHVDTAHLDRAEIVNQRKDPVKDEVIVGVGDIGNQLLQLLHICIPAQ